MSDRNNASNAESEKSSSCCGPASNCRAPSTPSPDRRDFIKTSGAAAAILMAGPFAAKELENAIPADKRLSKQWIASLYDRGEPLTATRGQFDFIGMPINGICTGQVYLSGDGQLWYWNLTAAKSNQNNPKGPAYMKPPKANTNYDIGFAISAGGKTRTLDAKGFKDVKFTNAYPMGNVSYADADCPVSVELQAWTPFIPLNRDESSYPAIVMQYTVTNNSKTAQEVAIAGWTPNISSAKTIKKAKGKKVQTYREFENLSLVECSADLPQNKTGKPTVDTCTTAIGLVGSQRPELVGLKKQQPGEAGVFDGETAEDNASASLGPGKPAYGSIGRKLTLEPGASQTISFIKSWSFPLVNYGVGFGRKGVTLGRNHYATVFPTAADATKQLANRINDLSQLTKIWTDTWYDSTLPYWFLERTFIPINCVQTQMGQRVFAKGKDRDIYNFEEGVRCCPGNCTHVWHYAQGLSRIFPVIERENRDRIEYGVGFSEKDGSIGHRYQRGKFGDAIDGNCGTILRVLRESQMTTDYSFLESIWDRVKLSMDHVIKKWDADEDGMLDGAQHNTLDEPWHGQVHWLINLYHAALKASAVMARQMKQPDVAQRYEAIVEKGVPAMIDLLWSEEFGYFIHVPGDSEKEKHGSTDGCHIDQLLGDSWLHNVGIDGLLPKEMVKKSLQSLWKHNFTPNVGDFRKIVKEGRWYAGEGDAGLVMTSFPHGKIEPKSGNKNYAGYLNECMTGFEWQAAAHMIREGLLQEGLAVGKAINDRYQPESRNPYNEIECSDHYSRAMASYGAFLAMCGYRYDGPEGKLFFGPKMQHAEFRAPFTTAEGWGQFRQQVTDGQQENALELRYGSLELKQLTLEAAPDTDPTTATVKIDDVEVKAELQRDGRQAVLKFESAVNLKAGQVLMVRFS